LTVGLRRGRRRRKQVFCEIQRSRLRRLLGAIACDERIFRELAIIAGHAHAVDRQGCNRSCALGINL
jgi:hypothetical protein